jgi:Protein of unknown function (DUF664).
MLNRTKGCLVLALLVATGFAGTLNNSAPTIEERNAVISSLKENKLALQKKLKGLSEKQLRFKPSSGSESISDQVTHLAAIETNAWQLLESAMLKPAEAGERELLTYKEDVDLVKSLGEPGQDDPGCLSARPSWHNLFEAASAFRQSRLTHLKFIRNTTADLRNHIVQTPVGTLDCYQVLLWVSVHADKHLAAIDKILSDPQFPSR